MNPVRDQHRNPVVQVLIGYENASEHPLRLHGLQVDEIGRHTAVVPFQLDVAMTRAPQGLRVRIAYQAELFLPSTIERWLTHFGVLLEGAVRNPDARLYDLPILPREEQQSLEATVQGSTAPIGSASTVD